MQKALWDKWRREKGAGVQHHTRYAILWAYTLSSGSVARSARCQHPRANNSWVKHLCCQKNNHSRRLGHRRTGRSILDVLLHVAPYIPTIDHHGTCQPPWHRTAGHLSHHLSQQGPVLRCFHPNKHRVTLPETNMEVDNPLFVEENNSIPGLPAGCYSLPWLLEGG